MGTYTDIYTFLRLLFSRVGKPFIGYSDTFSFNHPDGKCPTCDGLGKVTEIHLHQLVDFNKSLNEDPIDFPTFHKGKWRWKRYANSGLFDLDEKIKDYTPEEQDLLFYAPRQQIKNAPAEWPHTALYEGIVPRVQRSIIHSDEGRRHQKQLDRFVTVKECPDCHGSRVNEKVRSCKISGKNIADVVSMSLEQLKEFVTAISDPLAVNVKSEIMLRVQALIDIGLSYLTLERATGTLSGGEAQRIKIAKYINSSLNDIMYILDEPSAGLHPQDIERVSQALIAIKNKGNTVVLVEHHPQLIQMADYIIDIGPKAGEHGGVVQFAGPYSEFLQSNTITSRALHETVPLNDSPRTSENTLSIKNADLHNLKNFSVDIPLGVLAVICGVAGSGKSSLASVIYQKIMQQDKEMVYISQKNIGVNLRSTPMTYLNIFDEIRSLFAKENNVSPAWFSYNSKGACPRCKGKGIIVSDMSFMEDVTTVCELCHGTRYNEEATQYFYQGKNIVDVLDMNVNESFEFFKDQPFAQELKQLLDVGLGYLKLNQSLTTLSGGELQRLKLADNLHREGTIYLLDEPTDGLHLDDIQQLLDLFEQMVDEGNSIILLEHHMSVIKRADWVIEIGPEGGDKGGYLTFSGTVQDLAKTDNTVTAPYLVN